MLFDDRCSLFVVWLFVCLRVCVCLLVVCLFVRLMFVVWLLFVCLLFADRGVLFVVSWSMCVGCCLLCCSLCMVVVRCLLLVVCCFAVGVYPSLFVVGCVLLGCWRLLAGWRLLLAVVYYLSFAVCCVLLFVARCVCVLAVAGYSCFLLSFVVYRCLWYVVCRLLFLYVDWRSLFVVCCSLCVVGRSSFLRVVGCLVFVDGC